MFRRSERAQRAGFTLIELLVVVAIIALLIGLLLPSLANARDQAKATMCAGQIKELTRATVMWLTERQQDRIKGNLGWGARALRAMQGEGKVFTCPTDTKPSPRPAVLLQIYDGSTFKMECTADGIFTYAKLVRPTQGGWQVGFDDSSSVGGPYWCGADFDFNDISFMFTATAGQQSTRVVTTDNAGWDFRVSDYAGKGTQPAGGRPVDTRLMWGSYGINASAGFPNQPGRTIVLCETNDWSVWPESVADMCGGAPAQDDPAKLRQNLQQANGGKDPSGSKPQLRLRFRHGGPMINRFPDVVMTNDQRSRANVGFLDSHVERVGPEKVLTSVQMWHPPRKAGWVAPF